jgi:hypothetical protein
MKNKFERGRTRGNKTSTHPNPIRKITTNLVAGELDLTGREVEGEDGDGVRVLIGHD